MKKLGLLFVSVLFACGVSMASEGSAGFPAPKAEMQIQNPKKGGMNLDKMAKKQTQKLVEDLKLAKDQESKVFEINQEFLKKQTEIKTKMSSATDAEKEQLKKEMRQNRQEKNKQIKAQLTADQVKLYNEMQKKKK